MKLPGLWRPANGQASGIALLCVLCVSQPWSAYGSPQLLSPSYGSPQLRNGYQFAPAPRYPDQPQPNIYFPESNNQQYDYDQLPEANGALLFAWSMLKTHILPEKSNSALCPILPQALLANLYDVADKDTKAELRNALQATPRELQPMLDKQLLATNRSEANQLDYAMAYFTGKGASLNARYLKQIEKNGVAIRQVDFRNQNQAAYELNGWVSEKTRGIIREIVSPANLDPVTRLMMASVIYFKGTWKYQFHKTEPATFEQRPPAAGGRKSATQQVPMMYQYNKFRYDQIDFPGGNGVRWLEMPYEGTNGLSMLLILPKVRHQLQRSLEELSLDQLRDILNQLVVQRGAHKVHLSVPRFSVFSSSSLLPTLKKVGLNSVFDRPASLAELSEEPLVVRDVAQRTYIAVDEQGTTATSVATVTFIALSAIEPPPPVNFTVDEPFLAMIVDKINGYPMFVAKVVAPESY